MQLYLRRGRITRRFTPICGFASGLVPVGTLDPLLDDGLFMHVRWIAAGNDAELAIIYPGVVRGFAAFEDDLTSEANTRIDRFLAGLTRQVDWVVPR